MAETIELSKLNKLLLDLNNIKGTTVATHETNDFYDEKSQGDVGERVVVYDIGGGLFIKVVAESDSYGNEKGITSVQFVKPVTKQITDYSPI